MSADEQQGRLMDAPAIVLPVALVYVLDCDHGTKVGITRQTIEQRVDDLRRGSGLVDIRVVRTWPFTTWREARAVEAGAHWLLRGSRTVSEWFHCHPLEACDAVDSCIRHGIPIDSWMDAESAAGVRAYLARRAAA